VTSPAPVDARDLVCGDRGERCYRSPGCDSAAHERPFEHRSLIYPPRASWKANAPHAIDVISNEPGATTFNAPNGGTAVQNSSSPTKAYEIEVFDPGPAKALDLVESGDIQPVR